MSSYNPYQPQPTYGAPGASGGLVPFTDEEAARLGIPRGMYHKQSSVPGRAPQYTKGEGGIYYADGREYYPMTTADKWTRGMSIGIGGALGVLGGGVGAGLLAGGGAAGGGGGLLASSPLPSNMAGLAPALSGSVPAAAGAGGGLLAASALPSNMAGLSPALSGSGPTAAMNGNAGLAAAGNGAGAAGSAATQAAGGGFKSKAMDAIPLLAGLLFGSQGPFGGGGQAQGLNDVSPELQGILALMKQRMEAQGPLFSAVNQGAYNLLPNSAKSGGMFGMPSSTGVR